MLLTTKAKIYWPCVMVGGLIVAGGGCGEPQDVSVGDAGVGDALIDDQPISSGVASPVSCEPVVGPLQAAVIIVNSEADAVTCSADEVSELMFGESDSVHAFYRESSFGQFDVQGSVVAEVTLTTRVDEFCCRGMCDNMAFSRWFAEADAAAEASTAGLDLSTYDVRVYVTPPLSLCGGTNSNGVSRPGRALSSRCTATKVFAHEIGHTMGMQHSSVPGFEVGTASDYGDASDVMGIGFNQLNAPHRTQLGWLPKHQVIAVSEAGTYRLAMLETEQSAPQVLVIDRKDDPSQALLLSFRRPVGFDESLPAEFVDRTSIHQFVSKCSQDRPRSLLLGTIGDGEVFSDSAAGVSITQVTHSDSSATVTVEFFNE